MSYTYVDNDNEQVAEPQEPVQAIVFPTPVYTYVLLACIIGVTVVQFATGLDQSILAAGFDKIAFVRDHEYWRVITGAATHGNLPHILMNSWALYSFGRIVEVLTNRAHLAIVFLLSAIGGSLLSLAFAPGGISVGASGGIVGLIGYLAIYAFRRRQFISPEFRRSLLINIAFILVFGLILYQVVDNWGHIGGLLTGAVYGLVQIPGDEYKDPRIGRPGTEMVGLAALGIFIAASIFAILLMFRVI